MSHLLDGDLSFGYYYSGGKDMKTTDSKQPSKQKGANIFITLFLMIFVLGFGALGIGMIYSAYAQEKTYSETTEGEIVEYKTRRSSSKHKRMFCPVVKYQAEGEDVIGVSNTWSTSKPFKNSKRVTIGYNPANSGEFYIKGYDLKTEYRLGGIFIFVSIAILFVIFVFGILSKIKMDEEKKSKIQAKIVMASSILFIFIIFFLLSGPVITLCVFIAMGIFALYGVHSNKRQK